MADLNTDIARQLKGILERLENLEHHEFAFMHAGDGAPGHTAAQSTLYWDYTGEDLYINTDGGSTWNAFANV